MKEIPLDFENNTLKICAFTGHRELEESFSLEKLRKAVETLVEKGVETFYCGMAKGFDWSAQCLQSLLNAMTSRARE